MRTLYHLDLHYESCKRNCKSSAALMLTSKAAGGVVDYLENSSSCPAPELENTASHNIMARQVFASNKLMPRATLKLSMQFTQENF